MRKPFFAVELDSPGANGEQHAETDAFARYLERVRALAAAGANAVTIADNPLGSPRADSALLASAVTRETGVPVIPHLTCRDRNRNALLSALLALDLLGTHEILAVTGDPIRSEDRGSVKNLAAFDSAGFARLVAQWNESLFSRPFAVSAALNVNARNFGSELERAIRKERAGVYRFYTQPILCGEALQNLERARSVLDADILAGILPVVSAKNARFLSRGVQGIRLDPSIEGRFEGLDRESAADLAVDLSVETAQGALKHADGLYLITPFKRTDIIERILRRVHDCPGSGQRNQGAQGAYRVPLPQLAQAI